jgi:DNA-binding CsgD family transcriptional regulator
MLEVGKGRIERAMATLEKIGLVSRTPGEVSRYLPAAPDVGLEALIMSREAELGHVRTLARLWMADYLEGQRESGPELFEVVTGSEAVLHRFDQLQRSAADEVQVLDTPPYAGPAGPSTNDLEFDLLARGVTCKAIYDRAALEQSPGAIEWINQYVDAGEQARVANNLPFKLATFDRRLAFVPQSLDQRDVSGAIVVHPCSLLDMLLYIFDQLWDESVPIMADGLLAVPGEQPKRPGSDERKLLALLATGMTDQAISRHLGWSYRTTRRRIAALMAELGAENRFQAGLAAAKAGWF